MRKLLILFLMVGVLFFLFTSSVQAATFMFGDDAIYWPGWQNGTGDDTDDDIYDPELSGGQGEVNTQGDLTSLSINYDTYGGSSITAGALFVNSNTDSTWDYVLQPTSDDSGTIYDVAGMPGGEMSIIKGHWTNFLYANSDSFGFSEDYRINHPVGVATSSFPGINSIGTFEFEDFDNDTTSPVSFSTFSLSGGGDSLDLGSEFIIGFGPTCANDVIYETVANPVPIPTSILLFGSGLVGLAGISRKRR